ncbi:MAG: type II toxin-antitoxin system VapC family toxin [Acidobacteria bacterium]|nr:type II toxin-antitoxin system VapC family toxin [Acidobacteriota bacterium]
MITSVDTSVVLDVLGADLDHGLASRAALRRCRSEGRLVACEIVWVETCAAYDSPARGRDGLVELGIEFSPISAEAAQLAAEAWRAYRREGGSRARMIADFLIAAHAQTHAERLLTRDRGFYRRYFDDLRVVEPG